MHIPRLVQKLLVLPLCLLSLNAELSAAERPNVLLILCDDLGYSDLGCYGGEIQTPHLDRLAADGMRFTQFYNCAVCVTTRSALLTGLYPRQAKRPRLRTNMITLGEAMGRAGYATSLTGKWHLGSEPPSRPIDRGFGEFYGLLDGCCNFFDPAKPDPVFYNGGRFRPFAHNDKRVTEFPEDYYTTDAFSDHAAATIKRFAQGDKPFFVHLCYTAPHFPLHAFAEDIKRYRGKYSDGYLAMRERRHKRQAELGLFASLPKLSAEEDKKGDYRYDYDVPDWEQLPTAERQREEDRMETYAAMVDRMDRGVGRVLAALDEAGVANNTVVMFLSDNGGCATWPSGRSGQEEGFFEYNKHIPVGDGRGYEFVGKGWGWAAAHVACRSLGFGGVESLSTSAEYGRGLGPVVISHVECDGSEPRIERCRDYGLGDSTIPPACTHDDDVGVQCSLRSLPLPEPSPTAVDGARGTWAALSSGTRWRGASPAPV